MEDHHREERTLPARGSWEQLQVLLSNCLRHPDEDLRRAIEDGSLYEDLSRTMADVGLAEPSPPPSIDGRDLTEDYEALFGAFRQPFAPPAASPYKEWYGDHEGGLMEGPPATAMERRYAAMDAAVPEAYPADHLALELEYASVLTEAAEIDELATFVESELDWVDPFQELVDAAVAEAPFHRWCVDVLGEVLDHLRATLGVSAPEPKAVEQMAERARSNVE
ncbi:TorD/DmsD family molecular chaperone [Halodesulfurarchaeum formicicum]|uniref:Chaperone protein TorD n=1 Tax=Halodesulfurarchaeum formicicum TaxID=1873524 RepID=A0A1J1ADK8_9EURY|nr:molecular chaperone TorD family protein [Halodesulfurarchaeum formicicum]APE95859.1 chaperone protein TorD [Halodesulfurarchaeum formicicum]